MDVTFDASFPGCQGWNWDQGMSSASYLGYRGLHGWSDEQDFNNGNFTEETVGLGEGWWGHLLLGSVYLGDPSISYSNCNVILTVKTITLTNS